MKVSKSYQSYKYDETKAFEKNGKLYVAAVASCPRCSGKGIIVARVENGKLIQIPVDEGICYQCGGSGKVHKDIRLYTDEEFEKKEAAAARAKEKKLKELEERMAAEAEVNRAKWLEKNGFNQNKETYVYFPRNSYNVRDQLKDAGFRFSSFLLWHAPQIPEGYEDKVIKVHFNEVAEDSAWGDGHYIKDARSKVESAIKQALPPINSEWVGNIGDRIKELPVTLTLVRGFEGQWGYSQLVRFEDKQGNILKWFTSVDLSDYSIGDQILLTATIKDHTEDKYEDNAHVTIITRAKLKVA